MLDVGLTNNAMRYPKANRRTTTNKPREAKKKRCFEMVSLEKDKNIVAGNITLMNRVVSNVLSFF